jgi:hypothetical protein
LSPGIFDDGGGGGGSVLPLRVEGLHFRDDSGIWKYKGLTAFSAFDDWLKGRQDKLAHYAEWTRAIAANTWRVFFVWNNLGLKPTNHAYYNEALHFLEWLKGQGLYCHLVALCDQVDGSAVRLSKEDQIAHLRRMIEIARATGNALTEEFNEFEKNDDDGVCGLIHPTIYSHVLGTRSWWGENQHWNHAGALLSWTTGHTDRGQQWARACIQAFDVQQRGYGLPDDSEVPRTNIPHVLGEPRRIAEGTTPRQHADYHAGARLMGAGACLHGGFASLDPRHESDLQNCEIPSGLSLECAEAVGAVNRATLWPGDTVEFRHGRGAVNDWNEDSNPDCPIIHRDRYFGGSPSLPAYEEPTGQARTFYRERDGIYYGLAIDPGPEWHLTVRDGFELLEQGGFQGNMLTLRKV